MLRRSIAFSACLSAGLLLSAVMAVSAAAGTVTMTLVVRGSGTVQLTGALTTTVSTVYGTCSHSGPGKATCRVSVPTSLDALVTAQPSPGDAWHKSFFACSGAPGPVCHVEVNKTSLRAGVTFRKAAVAPTVATTSPIAVGNGTSAGSASCAQNDTVTANGAGFPADTAVTLSDNGTPVASGMTSGSGAASLTYQPLSEPDVYRTLTMTAGAGVASTDVFSEEYVQFVVGGTGSQVIITACDSDADASSSTTFIQYNGKPRVAIPANAHGTGSVTAPTYTCTPGKSFTVSFFGSRGAGSPFAYSFAPTKTTLTC
jgi:hypothetical protein